MNKIIISLLSVLICISVTTGCGDTTDQPETGPLRIYAGAGLRAALDQLSAEFEKETGISVEPDYGGSGMVLTRAQLDKNADLFMPGDVWYVDQLQEKAGSVTEQTAVTWFVPVIITAPGNPLNISSLKDFFRDDVKIAAGNPDKGPQVGRLFKKILAKNDLNWDDLKEPKLSTTVNELATWVAMKNVDVALVWDATAYNHRDEVETIEIPSENNIISNVVVGLLNTSKQPDKAKQFVKFMTGAKGRAILKQNGFRVDKP